MKPADTVRINVDVDSKGLEENVVVSDVKECTTLSAARECVSFERTKSVNWQKEGG